MKTQKEKNEEKKFYGLVDLFDLIPIPKKNTPKSIKKRCSINITNLVTHSK